MKTNIKNSHRQKQQKICLYFIDSQQYGGIRLGSILFLPLLKTDCGEDAENENKLFFLISALKFKVLNIILLVN